jgi:hypothetical protein
LIAFRDRKGRLWTGRLDVDAALRMRDLAGTDVMALAIDSSAGAAMEPPRLADAVYALLLPQAAFYGVTDREFGKCLRGRLWGWYLTPRDLAEMLFAEVSAFFAVPELAPGHAGKPMRNPTPEGLWGTLWQVAATAEVEPGPRTFGELIALADARRKNAWAHTASLLAWIENHAGMGSRRRVSPADRDPTGGMGKANRNELKIKGKDGVRSLALVFGLAGRN